MASPILMVSPDIVPADVGKSNDSEEHGEQRVVDNVDPKSPLAESTRSDSRRLHRPARGCNWYAIHRHHQLDHTSFGDDPSPAKNSNLASRMPVCAKPSNRSRPCACPVHLRVLLDFRQRGFEEDLHKLSAVVLFHQGNTCSPFSSLEKEGRLKNKTILHHLLTRDIRACDD